MKPAKMPCPDCEGRTLVYDSRGPVRWRECERCKVRFVTSESFVRRVPKKLDHNISDNPPNPPLYR